MSGMFIAAQAHPWYAVLQDDPYVLVPFFGYMIAVFIIAALAHRHQKTGDFESEYYVGNRSFGAWVLALSWVATIASGGTFLGYPSLIYSYGWTMAFWVGGSTITAIAGLGLVGKRINRLARQTGALTLVDLLRDRFHSDVLGATYAILIVLVTSVYLVAQFVAGARILQSMLDTSYLMGLILFAISVVAYTTYGGFRAVAWTDTLQGIVMIIGIVMLVPLTIHAVGGLEQATHGLMQRPDPIAVVQGRETARHAYLYAPGPSKITTELAQPPADGEPSEAPLEPFLPIGIGISIFVMRGIGGVLMPTTVPRMLAFRDTTALRRALLLLAPYFLLMYGSSLITMNCAHSLDLGLGPTESDRAVPELAKRVAPPFLAGILIAAPFAAVMSTVDSALLVISGSVVRDLVQKTFIPSLPEQRTRLLSYLVTAGAGVIIFCIALSRPPFLQPLVIHYVGGSASILFWPSMATLYWKRATARGVVAGLIAGAVTYVVMVPFETVIGWKPFLFGFIASGIMLVVVSRSTQPQSDSELELYFGRG